MRINYAINTCIPTSGAKIPVKLFMILLKADVYRSHTYTFCTSIKTGCFLVANYENNLKIFLTFTFYIFIKNIKIEIEIKAIFMRQSWRSGTRCECETDWLWVRSPLEEMKYLLKFIFPFLRSGVEVKRGVEFCHSTMPPEFGRKWGTECLNAKFPLPTLLCAGYSVKLI